MWWQSCFFFLFLLYGFVQDDDIYFVVVFRGWDDVGIIVRFDEGCLDFILNDVMVVINYICDEVIGYYFYVWLDGYYIVGDVDFIDVEILFGIVRCCVVVVCYYVFSRFGGVGFDQVVDLQVVFLDVLDIKFF